VSLSVDGQVPFVESFTTRADAWRGAKEHADHAAPGDVITLRIGEHVADELTPARLVDGLRAAWRATGAKP
jgi:hypothetical protein